MIVTPTEATVQLLRDDVAVRLADNLTILPATPALCDELIAALHNARDLLEQQASARSARAAWTSTPGTTVTRRFGDVA